MAKVVKLRGENLIGVKAKPKQVVYPVTSILSVVDEQDKSLNEILEGKLDNAVNEGTEGQILGLNNEGKPKWVNAPSGSVVDDSISPTSENPVQNKVIAEALSEKVSNEYVNNNFARKDGWYDTLVSGVAENLVGHGTTPAEYTFRTSGGNADIGTGAATIDVLKGKTLKWQQMINLSSETKTSNGITAVFDSNGSVTLSGTAGEGGAGITVFLFTNKLHKYYANFAPNKTIAGVTFRDRSSVQTTTKNAIWTFGVESLRYIEVIIAEGTDVTGLVFYPQLIDITDLSGAGNEPSTVEEFKALYPLDYYAHTATPILINNAASGIETTGFNQWDEVAETGQIDTTDGSNKPYAKQIRSVNYIKVFGGTNYYCRIPSPYRIRVFWYDSNKVYLNIYNEITNAIVQSPANAAFARICTIGTAYGGTYNNDICINLSWSGYRNGEYEPYEKHTLYFDTIKQAAGGLDTIKGKLLVDGEPTGESVTIFPDGMKSAGSVYDFGKADSDGYIRVGNRVFGVVDLGTLAWTYTQVESSGYFYAPLNDMLSAPARTLDSLICVKYPTLSDGSTFANAGDKTIGNRESPNLGIMIKDSSYTDAATFKTAMNGIELYYELATPEEYLLDTPIPANYLVNDFGTEQRIPVDTATANGVMSPIDYTVVYAMNASDQLRRMRVNFVSATGIDSSTPSTLDNLLTCLGTALNGTFTKSSYNSENENYTFNFTPNETPGE